jgi:general secretion pathway protein N
MSGQNKDRKIKMLRAVWAAKWYLILGLLTFTFVLVVTTPIHFVWRYVEPMLGNDMPVQLQQPVGTLWNGSLVINSPYTGPVKTEWMLSPLPLVLGQVELTLNANGENLRLDGLSEVSGVFSGTPERVTLTDVNGYLDSDVLKAFLMQQRTVLDGQFELSGLNADVSIAQRQVLNASGQLTYSGGELKARVQNQSIATELPMLVATMQMDGDKVVVPVVTADGDPLGQMYIQPDGWGGVSVLRRAVDIAGQEWPDKQADADTVIFEVSQKFL